MLLSYTNTSEPKVSLILIMYNLPLPEPSRLYSLVPQGIGTSEAESLASYAMRLAEAHCIDVSSLINCFIHPLVEGMRKATRSHRGVNQIDEISKHNVTRADLHINKWIGMTNETKATVAALSELTKREDLHLLTLLPLKGYVSPEYILRRQRTWCPCCYDAQKNTGMPVYDLLLWSFRDVCVCPRHNQRLWSRCFWCSARQPIIGLRSAPGYCMKCGAWLGGDYPRSVSLASQDLREAGIIGDFIAYLSDPPLSKAKKPPTIQQLLREDYR